MPGEPGSVDFSGVRVTTFKQNKMKHKTPSSHFFFLTPHLFIYFWLCWIFVSVRGLSLVVASGGHSSSRCAGLSLSRPLLLLSTGSRRAGSVVVAYGPSCSVACGIFRDQGLNPCTLKQQAGSQPLHHQGSPPSSHFDVQPRLRMTGLYVQTIEDMKK